MNKDISIHRNVCANSKSRITASDWLIANRYYIVELGNIWTENSMQPIIDNCTFGDFEVILNEAEYLASLKNNDDLKQK